MRKRATVLFALSATLLVTGCEYVRLLRPSVLRQLNPRVVRLVNELPEVDQPNAPVIDAWATFRLVPQPFREGMFYLAGDADVRPHPQSGAVKAIDPATGRQVWKWKGESPMVASMLATAGDLVFTGEPSGHFNAWHARTGELLWRFQTGNGIHSNPVTYRVNGKQYVGVPTGWGGWVEGFAPELLGAPRGTALVVFALP